MALLYLLKKSHLLEINTDTLNEDMVVRVGIRSRRGWAMSKTGLPTHW